MVAGSRGSTSMSWMRPPVAAGPMDRKCNESNGDCARATVVDQRRIAMRRSRTWIEPGKRYVNIQKRRGLRESGEFDLHSRSCNGAFPRVLVAFVLRGRLSF